MKNTVLYVVIPCYNEEEVLPETTKRLVEKLNNLILEEKISSYSKILYVDDGSKDKTWEMISEYHQNNNMISGLKISRNRGHQNALLAGLMTAKEHCDCAISIDADLQDDINVIDSFIENYDSGCDIVYGVRSDRETDTAFKRKTATVFYKLMKSLGSDVIYNHADCRLMSKRALQGLSEFKEVNLYLRGIVPMIGYKYSIVEYKRDKRFAGESKYPLKKMLALAFDGITSFSVKPIRLISFLGFSICIFALIALIYSFVSKLTGNAVAGWASIMFSVILLGGIQLLCIGIIGEYIGKIYMEVKARPRYIKDVFLNKTEQKDKDID